MAWINAQEIKSGTSSRKYTVSELEVDGIPTGTYGCSCPGWKSYGCCKHLTAMELPSARECKKGTPRGMGRGDNSTFQDSAYSHYDPYKEGYGNSAEWHRLARLLKGGKVNIGHHETPSNFQWDEIFRLVEERTLSPETMQTLDDWVTGNGMISASPQQIIGWLRSMPLR